LYLFLSAVELAYTDTQSKKDLFSSDFINSLKEFYSKLSENQIKTIEETLNKLNLSENFKDLFDIKTIIESFENLGVFLKRIITNLEFELTKIKNPNKQIDLEGKSIKKTHFILV